MAEQDKKDETLKALENYLGTPVSSTGKLMELINFLSSIKGLPNLIFKQTPGEAGSYDFMRKLLTLNPSYNKDESTATHEFTHALDMSMAYNSGLWGNKNPGLFSTPATEEQKRFAEAYAKMSPSLSQLPNPPIDPYRKRGDEMRAWGVSEQVKKGVNSANPHIDPTMATEFDILMELYKRANRQ